MRAGLTIGLVALAVLAAAAPAEARGRRGGFGIFFVSSRSHAAPAEPRAFRAQEPRLRTATADESGPEPMTTGATAPVVTREAAPARSPAPAPAQPWCATNRVFGSGAGFCAIN